MEAGRLTPPSGTFPMQAPMAATDPYMTMDAMQEEVTHASIATPPSSCGATVPVSVRRAALSVKRRRV
eukprot:4186074-Karenia_brevis.AAC.1